MENQDERTLLVLKEENLNKLYNSTVAIFGVGGVGGYVVEALVRSGVKDFILIDFDVVKLSNLNRQIIATHETIGLKKIDVIQKRILSIRPDSKIIPYPIFIESNTDLSFLNNVDYIVDAIDTITAKLHIIEYAKKTNKPIISSMGTGNKVDPTKFEITDIYKTTVCPLAKVMRKELKRRNINKLKVLYSPEIPLKVVVDDTNSTRHAPGSVSFVPSVAGLIIASAVIKDLINIKGEKNNEN